MNRDCDSDAHRELMLVSLRTLRIILQEHSGDNEALQNQLDSLGTTVLVYPPPPPKKHPPN